MVAERAGLDQHLLRHPQAAMVGNLAPDAARVLGMMILAINECQPFHHDPHHTSHHNRLR